jgi:hypothetical protein
LTEPDQQTDVAAAIEAAGGRSLITMAGCPGMRLDPPDAW